MSRFSPGLLYTPVRMDYALTLQGYRGGGDIPSDRVQWVSLLTEKMMILKHQSHPSLQEWLTDMTRNLMKNNLWSRQ